MRNTGIPELKMMEFQLKFGNENLEAMAHVESLIIKISFLIIWIEIYTKGSV